MFSGSKIQRPIITYSLEFTWINAEISNKQHVRKSSCPTKMLWVRLLMFFRLERNKNRVGTRRVAYEMFFGDEKTRQIIAHLRGSSWIIVEVSKKRFLLYQEIMCQSNPSAFIGITVQGIKSK